MPFGFAYPSDGRIFEPGLRGWEDGPRSGTEPGWKGWEDGPGPCKGPETLPVALFCPFFTVLLKNYLAMLQRVRCAR